MFEPGRLVFTTGEPENQDGDVASVRLLLIGAAAFDVASVLAASSTSPETLIAARALLGIAGATLTPSTMALTGTCSRTPRRWGW